MNTDLACYPSAPANVPADLTAPTARYRLQVVLVLTGLFVFVVLYIGLVILSAFLVYWSFTYSLGTVNRATILLKLGLICCSVMLFLFLLKGLFKRQKPDESLRVQISEGEQPELFKFIRRLCEETRAPFPKRVYLSPEVNAAVFYHSSILNLILPARKNLLIGLGLVNVMNLSEFKAVLAHEFGHFSQSSMKLGTYVYMSNRILADMVYARDWLDDLVSQAKGSDYRIAIFAWFFAGLVWGLRKLLEGIFRSINFLNSALSRQMEFNADLVAVSVTGSDALPLGLARLDFANEALMQAWQDLSAAAHHKLYTRDLFYHQLRAAEYLRRQRKDEKLGQPPPLPEDPHETNQVFKPGDAGVPRMWATHPSNHDRERNAKRHYIRGVLDDRSAWVFFRNSEGVREKVTRHFYRTLLHVPDDASLEAPERLQSFIDDEHAETTYAEHYHGMYDDRFISPGDLDALLASVRQTPPQPAQLAESYRLLYGEALQSRMEELKRHRGEAYVLSGLNSGQLKLSGKTFEFRGKQQDLAGIKKLLPLVEGEINADLRWLGNRDQEAIRVYYQMASALEVERARDLADRYRFHLQAQAMLSSLNAHQAHLRACLQGLSGQRNVSAEYFQQVLRFFREADENLEQQLTLASKLTIPPLKNVPAGQLLGPFLLDRPLVHRLGPSDKSLSGEWIGRFMGQCDEVCTKLRRVHFKSLGNILALQESIARDWLVQNPAQGSCAQG
jgi:Zn-dependent protease with chaperone function